MHTEFVLIRSEQSAIYIIIRVTHDDDGESRSLSKGSFLQITG